MKLKFNTIYGIGDRVLVNYIAQGDGSTHNKETGLTRFFHKGKILQTGKGTVKSIIVYEDEGEYKITYCVELDECMCNNKYQVVIGKEYVIERKVIFKELKPILVEI